SAQLSIAAHRSVRPADDRPLHCSENLPPKRRSARPLRRCRRNWIPAAWPLRSKPHDIAPLLALSPSATGTETLRRQARPQESIEMPLPKTTGTLYLLPRRSFSNPFLLAGQRNDWTNEQSLGPGDLLARRG